MESGWCEGVQMCGGREQFTSLPKAASYGQYCPIIFNLPSWAFPSPYKGECYFAQGRILPAKGRRLYSVQESNAHDEDPQEAIPGETLVSTVFYSLCRRIYRYKYKISPVVRNQAQPEVYRGSHAPILSVPSFL